METALVQPWPKAHSSGVERWYVRLLPSLTDFAFMLPLFLLFGMLPGATQLLSDGDTGWQIRTGDWILQHGKIPTTDFFSFTMPGQSWFAWEWGWDVVFAAIHRSTGLAGVVFVNVALLCLVSVLVYRLIRRYSDNDFLAFAFALLAICGSTLHWLARPHLVSWIFALLFSHLILSAQQGNRKALFYAPVLMLFWTNLHGGFFIGILLLLASAAGEVLQVLFAAGRRRSSYRQAYEYAACAIGCTLTTLVNPNGWHLHQHIIDYLRDSALLDNIGEFQTVNFHHAGTIFFECMLLIGVPAAFWCLSNRLTGLGLTVLFWAHAALFSGRNIPIFMLLCAAPAALMSEDLLHRVTRRSIFAKFASGLKETAAEFKIVERANRSYIVSGLALLFVGAGLSAGRGVFHSDFNPKNFPRQAVAAAHSASFNHLFTTDQWADYLLYSYYPSQKVFMDDRSDFYGADFIRKYQHIISAQYDYEDLLKEFSIDGVLVATDAPLATVLKHSSKWKVLSDDGSAIVLRRGNAAESRKEFLN